MSCSWPGTSTARFKINPFWANGQECTNRSLEFWLRFTSTETLQQISTEGSSPLCVLGWEPSSSAHRLRGYIGSYQTCFGCNKINQRQTVMWTPPPRPGHKWLTFPSNFEELPSLSSSYQIGDRIKRTKGTTGRLHIEAALTWTQKSMLIYACKWTSPMPG